MSGDVRQTGASHTLRAELVVRPLEPTDDMVALTEMIHRAFSSHYEAGRIFCASQQDVSATRQRLSGGVASHVAVVDGCVVGTVTGGWPKGGCPWYEKDGVFILSQLAVDPACQANGVGSALIEAVEATAKEIGATELALDTASTATPLIQFYRRRGYRVIGYLQWSARNYLSIVLSKRLRDDCEVTLTRGERVRWWLQVKRKQLRRLKKKLIGRGHDRRVLKP